MTGSKIGRIPAAAISLLLVLALAACSSGGGAGSQSSSQPKAAADVLIGSIWPMTGANAKFGQTSGRGAEFAVEQINAQGGIKALGGAKLKLIKGDATSDPAGTSAEMERIAGSNKMSGFVGAQASALTLAATEVAERYQVPFVTYSLADKLISRGFKYTFQTVPTATQWGVYPAEFVSTVLKAKGITDAKVGIIYEDSAYGATTSEGVRKQAKALGQNIVVDTAYPSGFTDASPLVLKIKQQGATVIYLASYVTDAVLIQKTLKEQGVNVTVIGTGAGHSTEEFGKILGKDADNVLVEEFSSRDMNLPGLADTVKAFEAKYNTKMDAQALGAYQCVWILKDAMEKAASADPKKIRDAMAELDLKGTSGDPGGYQMSGAVKFDAAGHNVNTASGMLQWHNGQLVSVWPEATAHEKLTFPAPPWTGG